MSHILQSIRFKLLFISLIVLINTLFSIHHFNTFYAPDEGVLKVINSDAEGYYQYLPWLFIKKNITGQPYGYLLENGNMLNKYTCGVALLQSPFFLITWLIESIKGKTVTGYEESFALSIIIASSFYLAVGLYFLFRLLSAWFNRLTAFFSLLVLYGATNLYYYSAFEPGMSHVYSFFTWSCFFYFTHKFYTLDKTIYGWLAMAFYSLSVLIRPTSAILLILFLFYNVNSFSDLKSRIRFLAKNTSFIVSSLLIALIIFLPQAWYWKLVTGKLLTYSYGVNNESFIYWKSPKILLVFFGAHSGWLPYTPIMAISLIILPYLAYYNYFNARVILLVFLTVLYLCASWWTYNFSCAFGYRSFVELYVLLVIPLAWLKHKILQKKSALFTGLMTVVLCFFIWLNIKMTYAYEPWNWCSDLWTKELYFRVLFSFFNFS